MYFSRDVIGDEDNCLSLNVYTRGLPDPSFSDSSNTAEKNGVPVIVWIHGGGFFIGGPFINDILLGTSPYQVD